jgi:class 3 adenylate cyclase
MPKSARSTIRVLFLAANPVGTAALRLDEEIREITAKIRAADHRNALELHSRWAVRPDDLQQALLEQQPTIVHFSGHGSLSEEVILEADDGTPKPVSTAALVSLFKTLKDNLRVVVLNACYSRAQAEAVTQVIDCAVGMKKAIGDKAAITFAASFYRALGFGRSIQEAFDLGRTALLLAGIPEDNAPELLVRKRVKPAKIVLVGGTMPGTGTEVTIRTPQGTEIRMQAITTAVVVVDLSRYSDITKELEQHAGVGATGQLNAQVQELTTNALQHIGVAVRHLPYKNTGDGAILALETAEQASRFAEALHHLAQTHNLKKDIPLAQRHFRVGIWTDTIILDRQVTPDGQFIGFEMAGTAIANAVRLEGACRTGEVLISPDTWGDLPREMRKLYGDQEEVKGKRGERFRAHRRKVVNSAPWDQPVESEPRQPAPQAETMDRVAFLTFLHGLSVTDFSKVLSALPGAASQVTKNAPIPDKVTELVAWVESSTGPGWDKLQKVARQVLNFR